MEMTNEEYKEYAEKHAPRSPVGKNCLSAFLVGGLICCVGQFINQLYTMAGLDTQSAATADSITLVFLGVLLWSSRPRASSPARRQKCSS